MKMLITDGYNIIFSVQFNQACTAVRNNYSWSYDTRYQTVYTEHAVLMVYASSLFKNS